MESTYGFVFMLDNLSSYGCGFHIPYMVWSLSRHGPAQPIYLYVNSGSEIPETVHDAPVSASNRPYDLKNVRSSTNLILTLTMNVRRTLGVLVERN